MEGTYEVFSAGQAVGSVIVRRQGLYYLFSCRCHLTGEVMFRLMLQSGDSYQDLGILTPMDGCFGLNTRISARQAGEGCPQFFLRPKREKLKMQLCRVSPEEPFAYLSRLESAYLVKQEGSVYLGFREEK